MNHFTEFDAHSFLGSDVAITCLSEPRNYAAVESTEGSALLCAELPCDPGDSTWVLEQDVDRWDHEVPGPLTLGRRGLFTHDNKRHALAMAYTIVECLTDGRFDRDRWVRCHGVFPTYVVED